MEERGNPLNDEELKLIEECSRKFEVHSEPEKENEEAEGGDDKVVKDGKGVKSGKASKKESKGPKVPKEGKRPKVPKEGKASKDIKEVKEGPKDVKVNYRGNEYDFSTHMLCKIIVTLFPFFLFFHYIVLTSQRAYLSHVIFPFGI